MIFNGTDAWFVPPTSRYGLSKVSSKDLHLNDFTFCARIKVDWDFLVPESKTQEAGIMVKNGKHLGLSVAKSGDNYRMLKGMCWTEESKKIEGSDKPFIVTKPEEIFIPLNAQTDISEDYIDMAISFNLTEKKFKVVANDFEKTQTYDNDLVDYTASWLWIGVCNPLDSCPEDHRQYFKGDIAFSAVFQKYMEYDDIKRIFDGGWSKNDKPIAVYDFKDVTSYKALDITKNGNNLIKYDKTWMDEN